MKKMAYEVVYRFSSSYDNYKSVNNGFVIASIDDNDTITKLEGVLTSDYLIGEVEKDGNMLIKIYSSSFISELCPPKSFPSRPYPYMFIDWQDYFPVDEIEIPIFFEIYHEVSSDGKVIDEKKKKEDNGSNIKVEDGEDEDEVFEKWSELISTGKIDDSELQDYIKYLEDFKKKILFIR